MCWTWLTKHSLERSDTENRSKEWGTFLRCNYLGCDFNRVQGLLMVGWFRYHIVSLTISIWRTSSKALILQRGLPKLQHVFLNGMVLEEKQQYLECWSESLHAGCQFFGLLFSGSQTFVRGWTRCVGCDQEAMRGAALHEHWAQLRGVCCRMLFVIVPPVI